MIWRQFMSPLASFGTQPFQICQQAFRHKQRAAIYSQTFVSSRVSIENVRPCGVMTLSRSADDGFEVCVAVYRI